MSNSSRRSFCRALGGLACVGLGGCKIEPILGVESEDERALVFPELPPQIPDQLADAETTLRELTLRVLETEHPLLLDGRLRERPAEQPVAVSHFVELMRGFGLVPAGSRGGWLLPVMLDVVEPTGATPRVSARPQSEAPLAAPDPKPDPKPDPGPDPKPDPKPDPNAPPPAPPDPDPSTLAPDPDPDAHPSRAIDLAALGAFRQRGSATTHAGLQLSPVLDYAAPLPTEPLVGRVAVLRAPRDLDLTAEDAPALVDSMMSAALDAGAIGCLLLTRDEGPVIERFRERWRRQVRRATTATDTLLIEGLLLDSARAPLAAALDEDEAWVLDLDLATQRQSVESHNLLGRVTGREHPDEAVVLVCNWDTPDPNEHERDSLRLLATLGACFQLAEWSRRSAPPPYSLILLLTADAGLAAGQIAHATWADNFGAKTTALVALDRPTREPLPMLLLSGRYDAPIAKIAERVVAADGHALALDDQLALPALAPYLRYPAPVLTIGAPPPEDVIVEAKGPRPEPDAGEDEATATEQPDEQPDDPLDRIYADSRLLRNLVLALAALGR